MKNVLIGLPGDPEWRDSHDWVEFPVAVDVLEAVKVILRPYGYTPEDACALFLNRMVERKDEILEKHKSGVPAQQVIRDLSDDVVKEIFDHKAFKHYDDDDRRLDAMLPQLHLLENVDCEALKLRRDVETYPVVLPDSEYGFLHEAAVISYHGTLYASWYNCREYELIGRTPIRGSRSTDGGRTWSEPEVIADDPTGEIMYCPPVYGICDDRLYMFINEMYGAPDHIHALDLYVLEDGVFRKLWSRPIPFKLNTNVCMLPNGKLMLPGRIAELDGFPNTPAVLISDSGRIDAEWRPVYIQPDGSLPDGSKLHHPELTAIVDADKILVFSRDDERRVPLAYLSEDCGEHWSGPYAHDIPFSNSKIYAGLLSSGRRYVIGNLDPERSRLAMFLTEPNETVFTQGFLLQDGINEELGFGRRWHYPVAWEDDGILYIIYTVSISEPGRGCVISKIPLQ